MRLRTISAVVAAGLLVVQPIAVRTSEAATPVPVGTAIYRAVGYAHTHGYRTGIAVLDTVTGKFWGAGSYASAFGSESVVKTMIATEILLKHRMYGTTKRIAYKMITQSDDASANRLYGLAGGDQVINRMERHYHINIGYPPHRAGWWGNTHIYARGLVYFYRAIRRDPRVWPWLGYAMHHSTAYGSDGTYQHFGIPSATTGAAVKQGWGVDDDCFCHAILNSTGLVGHDRYAVAILTSGSPSTYYSRIARMITSEARLLLPAGYVDLPQYHNPHSNLWFVHAYANTLHLEGWAIDPDARTTPLWIHVYDNGHLRMWMRTDRYYAALNARWRGARGNHAYYITTLQVPNGTHSICVRAFNVGYGTANSLRCMWVKVNGSPFGWLDTVTAASNQSVTLTGWVLDPSARTSSTDVRIYDGSHYVGTYRATKYRADVNARYHTTGYHGFSVTLPAQTPGAHVYHAYAVNVGYPNPNVLLHGRSGAVTVPAPPPPPPTTTSPPPSTSSPSESVPPSIPPTDTVAPSDSPSEPEPSPSGG
jgi:hypothetical protein